MSGPRRLPAKREHTGEPSLDRMQASTNDVVAMLRACPFIVGKLVSVTFVAGVTKIVNHRLGTPAACFVARQPDEAVVLLEVLSERHDVNNALPLVCSDNATMDLWFYPRASKRIDTATGQSR